MTDLNELHALADGHLTKEEANAVRDRCKQDPGQSAELNAILNLKDCLSQKALTHSNEEAWRKCVTRLDALDKSRRVEGFVGKYAWGICAILFVTILSSRFAMHGVRGDSVQTADLGQMFGGFGHRASQGSAELDALLARVRPLVSPDRIEVLGASNGMANGMPVTRFDLRDADGRMALVVINGNLNIQDTAPMPGDPPMYAGMVNGLNCVAWNVGNHTLLLVGSREPERLQGVARRIRGR